MIDMVFDSEPSLDQIANSGAGPQIRRKPHALRPFEKASLKLSFLFGGQFGRPAGSRARFDPGLSLLKEARLPAADGAAVHLHSLGDVYGRKSLFKQSNGFETTLFKLRWAAEWSHAQRIGH